MTDYNSTSPLYYTFQPSRCLPTFPCLWRGQKSPLGNGEKLQREKREESNLTPPPIPGFPTQVITEM